MTAPPRSVAIVGGGITGLTAAFELSRSEDPLERIALYEGAERVGGKVRTVSFAGGYVEAGPDAFLARESWVEDLCRRVGLGDELVQPALFGGAVWIDGVARPLPTKSLWGLPASPGAALAAKALAIPQRVRALGDLVVAGPLRGPDVSVADFVARRFGRGVLERLVDPLLAGTRAGSTDAMSLAAALPQIDALARSYRSIMRAASAQRSAGAAPAFLSLKGGMQRLTDALDRALEGKVEAHKGVAVESVSPAADGCTVDAGGAPERFDAVVLCVPAPAAAGILRSGAPDAARGLDDIAYSPSVSVALRYPKGAIDPPAGTSGVLVPSNQNMTVSGCTWWGTKWPDAQADDAVIVRCFVGRGVDLGMDDETFASLCARDVAVIAKAQAPPVEHHVDRWAHGLPRYTVGHLERLERIERSLPPHIVLAGAGYRGTGLPDCVKQAHQAVRRLPDISPLPPRAVKGSDPAR